MKTFAVCGDSGTGKTTMAATLARHLFNVMILECDRYHKWERGDPNWKHFTHLNPEANKIDLMNQDIQTLKKGKSIFQRSYSHDTGTFTEEEEIRSAENIITCGLHTLVCPDGLYDVKIFMDTDPILKTQWKISRDVGKRGYSLEQVKEQIENRLGDYESFLQPLALSADVIVNFRNETDLYIDSIKGIGRFLRIFVKKEHKANRILQQLDDMDVDYTFSEGDRPGFWQLDIRGGSYYDYVVLCVLDILKWKNFQNS